MGRAIGYAGVFIAAAAVAASLGAQVAPSRSGADGPDIVVNGATPKMVAGLWRFRSGVTLTDPAPGEPRVPPEQGREWNRCIADGDTPAIVDQLIGEQAGIRAIGDSGMLCSPLKLVIDRTHAAGNRRCSVMMDGGPALQIATGLRATIAETRLQADYVVESGSFRSRGRIKRWQVNAERIGDCPGSPWAAPAPVPKPASSAISPESIAPARQAEPTIVRETSATPETAGAVPSGPTTPTAEASTQPDDIVVIARRLRRLRLRYGVDGDRVRWCHADISSGDKRVDRIGCAIVRACTKSGANTVEATLACFRRRVDSLEPDPPPA
ncbi:hypothetical protein DC429_07350 [Arthrobacter sp. TPD3018]|uniref:hypothetical protein n=1 Tax=Bacteria TaxID=2 RepID=UPI000D50F477|nr:MULTISPECIES: hypothetical protein [Bacteria]PVE60157.1 hypothetical protein DC425_07340 [Sphingomonas sp. TPD3009]PVE61670.1 hypothetical protein DC429_07350 [Arthrobacter sp. TPD3018]PVE85412.1 hypothetical protein DC431_05835 [Sphingomonas melonis]